MSTTRTSSRNTYLIDTLFHTSNQNNLDFEFDPVELMSMNTDLNTVTDAREINNTKNMPPKRGRGRPKGSTKDSSKKRKKSKFQSDDDEEDDDEEEVIEEHIEEIPDDENTESDDDENNDDDVPFQNLESRDPTMNKSAILFKDIQVHPSNQTVLAALEQHLGKGIIQSNSTPVTPLRRPTINESELIKEKLLPTPLQLHIPNPPSRERTLMRSRNPTSSSSSTTTTTTTTASLLTGINTTSLLNNVITSSSSSNSSSIQTMSIMERLINRFGTNTDEIKTKIFGKNMLDDFYPYLEYYGSVGKQKSFPLQYSKIEMNSNNQAQIIHQLSNSLCFILKSHDLIAYKKLTNEVSPEQIAKISFGIWNLIKKDNEMEIETLLPPVNFNFAKFEYLHFNLEMIIPDVMEKIPLSYGLIDLQTGEKYQYKLMRLFKDIIDE